MKIFKYIRFKRDTRRFTSRSPYIYDGYVSELFVNPGLERQLIPESCMKFDENFVNCCLTRIGDKL